MLPESLVRSSTPENLCLGYNPSSPPEQCSTDGPFAQAEAIVQPEEAQGKQVVEETLVDLKEASLPEPAPEPRMDIQVRVTEQPRSPKSNRSPSPQLGSQAAAAAEGRAIWRPSAAAAEGHARQSRSASRSRSPARSGKGSLPDCPFPLDDSAVPLKSVAAI
uniref:Uncharacterized protein n=1 Tax=Zooxanthella nutricula TaxID=1333877 RepID=A0A7S2N661_9DINO